jgi:RimJ/RimL family protein N-acetyltransferase
MAPKSDWVSVKTTLPARPLPPNSSRAAVTTERLIIRPLVPGDVEALHVLRTQPEVMANTPQGRIDRDLEQTRQKLVPFLPPHDDKTLQCAICLRATEEMIGVGGCHSLDSVFGWPAMGYMLRREVWGRGLATEFVRAWLDVWDGLPREEVEVVVSPDSLVSGDGEALEVVTAFTTGDNVASQRVLEKSGFECFLTWREPDLRNPEVEVELRGYRCLVPYRETRNEERDMTELARVVS